MFFFEDLKADCTFIKIKGYMATALITGASNGIGLELAKIHAAKGDNLVLVARNLNKLNEIKTELEGQFKISVHTIGKDLSLLNAAQEVYDELKQKNIAVNYLINNAGFGDYGFFLRNRLE
jgi:short-subunit dehydrogenase